MNRFVSSIIKYFRFVSLPETEDETLSRAKHLRTALTIFILYFSLHTYLVVPKLAGSWEATLVHPRFITGNIGIVLSLLALGLYKAGWTRLAGIIGSYQFTVVGIVLFLSPTILEKSAYVAFSIVAVGIMVSNLIAVMKDVLIYASVSTAAMIVTNNILGAFPGADMTSRMIVVYCALTYSFVVVHHRRRLFIENKESHDMLVKQTKMATLGQMAGGVAHEINNPLAIISGGVHKLRRFDEKEGISGEQRKKVYDLLDQTTNRIAKIINGLRNFARDGSQDPMEMTLVSNLINDSVTVVEQKSKKLGVRLLIDLYDETLTVNCRPIEISRVIVNLLSNAFDAVENVNSKWARIRVHDQGNSIAIDVVDSGPGVPPEIQKKILQPFFTTKKAGEGTGLGLSLSQKVMEDHKGLLEYKADMPFSTFRITIPKTGSVAAPAPQKTAA
jgi:signal transduction histidine kinase